MPLYDVTKIDVHRLVLELWLNSKYPILVKLFGLSYNRTPTLQDIRELLEKNRKLTYVFGRYIMVDFTDPTKVDSSLYDKEIGHAEFGRIYSTIIRNPTISRVYL